MGADSSDLSDVQPAGRVKTQTFRQFQLERLIKEGKVVPASKLAEAKERELRQTREFEAAAEDERRHKRAPLNDPNERLKSLPLTRERFEG
jgi:hypothetical protein